MNLSLTPTGQNPIPGRWKTFFTNTLKVVAILFLYFIVPHSTMAQTFPDASSCTSKDLTIVGATLINANPCNSACTDGNRPLELYIYNKTGSTRTSFAFWGTLNIYAANGDLLSSTPISGCVGDVQPKSIKTLPYGNVYYTCGSKLEITDIHLAWTDASPTSTCSTLTDHPELINPKCGTQAVQPIDVGVNGAFGVTDVTCYGGNNGAIDLTPSGGTAPYTYAWTTSDGAILSGQEDDEDLTGLVPGTYQVTITDANGCTATRSTTVNAPAAALSLGVCTKTYTTCAGNDGSVIAGTVTNAVGTVKYSWKNSAGTEVGTDPTVTGLVPGTYYLTVSDDCSSQTCNVTIITDNSLTVPTGSPTAATCTNANGSVQVDSYNSNITYTLVQNSVVQYTSGNTGLFSSVAPGTYDLVATLGVCSKTGSVTVDGPTNNLPTPTASVTNPDCTQTSGSVQVNNPSSLYSYTLKQNNSIIYTADNTGLFSAVAPGSYDLVATQGSCSKVGSVTVDPPTVCAGHVFPTGTTCCQFVNGQTNVLPFICYTADTKKKQVTNAVPGVFFYYSFITAPAANFYIEVRQANNQGTFKYFAAANDQNTRLTDALCNTKAKFTLTTLAGGSGIRYTVTGATKGATYVISVKYDTKSILGSTYTAANPPDVNYTFKAYTATALSGNTLASPTLAYGSVSQIIARSGCSDNTKPQSGTCTISAPLTVNKQVTPEVQELVTKLNATAAPNPYNDKIRFTIASPVSGQGSLEVFNLLGQKVATVFQGFVEGGKTQTVEYTVPDGHRTNLIYQFKVGDQRVTGKLLH